MKKIKINEEIKKVHFIGVGGISMSSLAELLHKSGYIVTGSDRNKSKAALNLESMGIKVTDHDAKNIVDDLDLVVHTVAIKNDNVEIIEANKKNIKIIDRAELLGKVIDNYKYPICISGTHGKTTTTSMLAEVFLTGKMDPSISLGGYYKSANGTFGDSEYFIAEACEYYDSFLKFYPYIGIILNVEEDHLDYFEDLNQIMDSFKKFGQNISIDGALILNNTIKDMELIADNVKTRIITYGNEEADYFAKDIIYGDFGKTSYILVYKNKEICKVNLNVAGFHNVLNSMAVFATCKVLNTNDDIILKGLENFKGPDRRFQLKGKTSKGVTVIDDYAHHPTEIAFSLGSAKQYKHNKIYCVFQPHTFTRTKALLDDFSKAFTLADEIIILDIFAAREKDTGEISSRDLVKKIESQGKNVKYIKDFETCTKFLTDNCVENDLLITMGAGNVNLVGEIVFELDLLTQSTDL